MKSAALLSALCAVVAGGCIQVKTESEIKPIHITMDVNLKVDKELDKAFADENPAKPADGFGRIRDLLARQAAGVTSMGMLEARQGATDDDRLFVAEDNVRRLKRFGEIAKKNGVTVDAVRRRHVRQLRERVHPGTWLQEDDGTWKRK